jgi:hypothetical protein
MKKITDLWMPSVTIGRSNRAAVRYRFSGIVGVLLTVQIGSGSVHAHPPDDNPPVGEARVPGLFGATGLLQMPSAYVQRDTQVSFFLSAGDSSGSGGALFGLANRLEVGGRGEKTQGQSGQFLANAKLNLLPEELIRLALSVGVVDAFGGSATETGWYVVTSKYLIPYFLEALTGRSVPVKLHLGYGDGAFGRRLFVGGELFFNDRVAGMAEVVHGKANLGVRYYGRGFSGTAGLLGGDGIVLNVAYGITLR